MPGFVEISPVVLGNSIYERLARATAPPGFPIQITGGDVVVTQTGLRDPQCATSEKRPLDDSAVEEFVL
jgi:hypothetical protein